jgi:hypothetical protein
MTFADAGNDGGNPLASGNRRRDMVPLLLVLLLIVLLAGAGFALKALWIAAIVLLVVWLIGFVSRGAEGARWYRW